MKLKQLEVNSFAGISPTAPVVIDFTKTKWVNSEGDMGTGKTSLLNAMLVACGQLSHTGKEGKNFINQETDKIDINFSFVGNDRYTYDVRCTKSKFELSYEGESVPEPITKMKELLGVVGVSPMAIKDKPLKDIVKWLSGYSKKSAEEFEAQLLKFKNGIKTARESRATANKSFKGLDEYLLNEEMFNKWAESEKKYIKAPDIKELSTKLSAAGIKSDKYIRAEERVKRLKEDRPGIEKEIERLEQALNDRKFELSEHDKTIEVGNKYLVDNKADKTEYDSIKKKYDTAAEDVVSFNKWQEIKRKKKERDEFETLSQTADTTEKELLQQQKELQAEILPDIKGVEMITEDTHEDGIIKKEGLYWNDKNVAQLSESEWWSVVLLIWRKYKVKVIVIDNMQSLGSGAIGILEKLVQEGCYILSAEMDRQTKTLSIEYK